MTEYTCLKPEACKAVTPGKICRSCFMTQRNKSPEMRAFLSRTRKGIYTFVKDGVDTARLPETNARRSNARMNTQFPWLPPEYRPVYARLRRQYPRAEAREMVIAQVDADKRRFDTLSARFDKIGAELLRLRMEASHERMKRGGTILYRK